MKTNFDGIKKTSKKNLQLAEQNFIEEIELYKARKRHNLSEKIWAIIITLTGLGLFGYMVVYHIIYKLIIQ